MSLAPLIDYMSALNGGYGLAIAAVAILLLILSATLSKTNGRSRALDVLILAASAALTLLYAGFLIFIFYKSYSGVSYGFWQLACSIFLAVNAFGLTLIMQRAPEDGFREAGIFLILTFVASLIFSPMVVGMLRLFETFHPLWP